MNLEGLKSVLNERQLMDIRNQLRKNIREQQEALRALGGSEGTGNTSAALDELRGATAAPREREEPSPAAGDKYKNKYGEWWRDRPHGLLGQEPGPNTVLRAVMELRRKGLTPTDIGHSLSISRDTVEQKLATLRRRQLDLGEETVDSTH